MKRLFAVLLVLFCIAGFSGVAGAENLSDDFISDETMLVIPILGIQTEIIVYHPFSMLITDTEVDKLQVLGNLVWIPANDGAAAGFYYPKMISMSMVPEGMTYSSFWIPEQ